jgi:hypothetical protein
VIRSFKLSRSTASHPRSSPPTPQHWTWIKSQRA